ncbi:DUF262 domain-containing protein [Streptomyces sp. JJ66]|uniref:DUF262 domain-containing protein n=1 Tax=Streptomyces sp. JJ66 TaxID=2803843 RepID=UPI0027E300D6|nr:DUF262 domain-containing protein [Streptomyces sp. JJ66]
MTKPKVTREDLSRLLQWTREGRIRIPQFQRSYRWEPLDAERLFDSILRGYPIGNLLMWRKPAPADEIYFGELRLAVPALSDALWVVDGQQRLTTLVGALSASGETVDRRFRIFYDLQQGKFVSVSHGRRIEDHLLPVWVAGDNRRLLAWQRKRPWLTEEEFDQCDAVASALRTYEIPMYEIEGDDEQALTEIFDRMNTFGKRLKRAEIFKALHSAPLGLQPSDPEALRDRVSAFGFGDLSPQLLMQSVMAVRGGKVDRDFRQEFTSDADRHSAFTRTEKAIRLVVEFLREEAGIPHVRLLPYALFVPVLARYAALFGRPEGRGAELLRRWVWRGAVGGAAPQGNTVALRRNASAVEGDPVASANRLLQLLPPGGERWRPDLTQTALNRAQAKVNVLGLLSQHPVLLCDITSEGSSYARGTRVDQTRLLVDSLNQGASLLLPVLPGDRSMANRLVHPAGAGEQGKSLLLGDHPEAVLRSHCLDEESLELLQRGQLRDFLERRAAAAQGVISHHVQSMALWGFADGPDPEAWFEDSRSWGDNDAA